MHTPRSAIAGILSLLAVASASGQQFPSVPDKSVIGRVGTGGSSGPSQAIPFSILNQSILNSLCQTNNAFPVYSSSAATWVCSTAPSANTVFAGPSTGSAAQPTFRALVGADLPLPGASSLGGVKSLAAVSHNFLTSIGTDGGPTQAQPAFTDISGSVAATQLPNPSATTLGGVQSKTVVTHQFLNTISTSGVPGSAQPACADISDAGVGCNAARGQLPGETATGSATAGNVGEYIESVVAVGSAVSLSTGVAKDFTTLTLSAGDWDVTQTTSFTGGSTTTVNNLIGSISASANTLDQTIGRYTAQAYNAFTVFNNMPNSVASVGSVTVRFSLSGSTTLHAIGQCSFGVSTCSAFGIIRARRVR